jgi:hypothetical protein
VSSQLAAATDQDVADDNFAAWIDLSEQNCRLDVHGELLEFALLVDDHDPPGAERKDLDQATDENPGTPRD